MSERFANLNMLLSERMNYIERDQDMTESDYSTPDITQFEIDAIDQPEASQKVPGYYVYSTAAINIEDNLLPTNSAPVITKIREIADHLTTSSERQLVIAIHGYGTQRADAKQRYQKMHTHGAEICQTNHAVFLGYLWPSEKPTGEKANDPAINSTVQTKLKDAINALPFLLLGMVSVGLIASIVTTLLLLTIDGLNKLLTPILILSLLAFSLVFVLILLRLSTYFRDNYRATNYGVLDLVELIRQLDQAIAEKSGLTDKATLGKDQRIKLSFIGHSMGCFVVTNTIRILSDVFDPNSIAQNPPSDIGRVFSLGRLVLVAPDIPTESIMPRRANFLRSSLRRCEEAYVFCNEGDLALRLASTAANYFSFPAKARSSGYRLGNVTAKHFSDRTTNESVSANRYGIINWSGQGDAPIASPSQHLEVRASNHEHWSLEELREYKVQREVQGTVVADLFTYFDCTDYIDLQDELKPSEPQDARRGVVSFALRKAALNFGDYARLNVSYFKQSLGFGGVNVHGGYFSGLWSQQIIYGVAFLGFRQFLQSLPLPVITDDESSPDAMKQHLDNFATLCSDKGIQVVLSPIRYEKDVLGVNPPVPPPETMPPL